MDEFEDEIGLKLSLLADKAKLLFAALTSEKLYPNYIAFEEKNHWGNNNILQEAISLIYQYLINPTLNFDFKDIITRIELITPDTEDFSDLTTSFALDACTSLVATIKLLWIMT